MHIKIFGYHIFQKGGTSRSNINLIQSLIEAGHQVTYVNYVGFRKKHLKQFIEAEGEALRQASIVQFKGIKGLLGADLLILTRESFFQLSREVKKRAPHSIILGEIHGPVSSIPASYDLALEAIDAVRVSTPEIAQTFEERFDYPYVFPMYVNTHHINVVSKPVPNTRNLYMKTRFEERIKAVSYAIRLMRYIVYTQEEKGVHLYLEGYGPSLSLYQQLVHYYRLEQYVHINEATPSEYIYLSTSPYETLSYSILEAIGSGNRACIYPGEDNALQSIYQPFHAVRWMHKTLEADYDVLSEMWQHDYTEQERKEDVAQFNQQFRREDVSSLLEQVQQIAASHQIKAQQLKTHPMSAKRFYLKGCMQRSLQRTKRLMPNVPKPKKGLPFKLYQLGRRGVFQSEKLVKRFKHQKSTVDAMTIFVESFHGKNFSGDPKYIALVLQRLYPEARIYVSSANELVDMEIQSYRMIPIRFGSKSYVHAFDRSKYIVINGNLWDRLVKHPQQKVIQTWHGFPLKRMVNDLNDYNERKAQRKAFQPRMKKWDVLLSSSAQYEKLVTSAFNLTSSPNLSVWNEGAPRNSILLENNAALKSAIQQKYLFLKDPTKKYILFCPTWRKNKRERVSELDLADLLHYLPKSYEVIVKLHPNEGHMHHVYEDIHPRVHCFDNSLVDIQELYLISDVLITDYSSAIFDFAHLNRPIIVLEEDVDLYNQSIGFYFDIKQLKTIHRVRANATTISRIILNEKTVNHEWITAQLMTYDHATSDESVANRIMKLK